MSRYDLTDFEWNAIEPLLPNKPRGVARVGDRRVLNGILWVLFAPALRGGTCRRVMGLTRPATTASIGGGASGIA